jgi:hypothetical protein
VPLFGPGNASKGNLAWAKVHSSLKSETMWKSTKKIADTYLEWGPAELEGRAELLVSWAMERWPRVA